MNAAATQDVREVTLEPLLSKLLRRGKAPNARDATMLATLDAWYRHGASRLDRTDATGTGNITDPGAAIMDTAWPRSPTPGPRRCSGRRCRPSSAASTRRSTSRPCGQYTGWHIYMNKDLRTLLGERVRGAVHRPLLRRRHAEALPPRSCGARSTRPATRWPRRRVRTRRPGASSATAERIKFVPLGLLPYTMRYTNRPSGIQQVLSFGGHAPGDTGR